MIISPISVFLHSCSMAGYLQSCVECFIICRFFLSIDINNMFPFSISYHLTLMQILAGQSETALNFFLNSYCVCVSNKHTHILNLVCFVQSGGVKDSSVFCIKIKQWVVIVTMRKGWAICSSFQPWQREGLKREEERCTFPPYVFIRPQISLLHLEV